MNAHTPSDPIEQMQKELEARILTVIDEIDKGFRRVMDMYSIAFYTGLGIIVFSFLGTLYLGKNIFLLLFGGVGVIDIAAFFIYKPVEDLQRSRANLAQLVSAFLTWYNDTHNWNQLLAKELVKDPSDVKVFQEVSKRSIINTITIMAAIEIFVASRLTSKPGEELKTIIRELEERIAGV